jgi:hypothetical protein
MVGGIALLSSCNADERQEGDDPSRELTFLAYARKGSQTRVEATTSTNIETFNVFGIWSGLNAPLPNLKPAVVTGGQGHWSYTPKQPWPETGKINFYAYSPNAPVGLTPNYNAGAWNDMSVTYAIPTPPSDFSDPSDQADLLVAVKPGVNCSAPAPVSLNFQHALSRVRLKARMAFESTSVYMVNRVRFVHLSNRAKLALSTANIPDGSGFTYDDELDRTPLVLWEDHNDPDTNYEFVFDPEVTVSSHVNYSDVIADADAFFVIPQTTQLGGVTPIADYESATDPADPADDKLYIRIDFASSEEPDKIKVKYYAVREPLDPARKLPLTFEAGRSYTFVVDLSGSDYINFADVLVSEFNEAFNDISKDIDITNPLHTDLDPVLTGEAYMPTPHTGFAGSYIYWDSVNERMTFEDVDYDPAKEPANAGLNSDDPGYVDKSQYQGLFFKWGSLVGISPRSANWGATTVLYAPTGPNGHYVKTDASKYAASNWGNVTVGSGATINAITGVSNLRLSGYATYLNTLPDQVAAHRGDICAYLSGRPGIPKGFWRMPTSAEFDPGFPAAFVQADHYTKSTTYAAVTSTEDDGTFVIKSGYTLTSSPANKRPVFFPAGGYRNPTNGNASDVGTHVGVWSSSPAGANSNYLYGIAASINPAQAVARTHGLQVRCVRKEYM